ncbi:MAG: response regulator, partial [Deltaproteobacteria bacterium]|nr:response regulator [Deltaproteobacteria bacterium]
LTFSRQVPGKLRPVDLNREIEDMARLLDRTLPKMITTELRLAQDLKIIDADPVQLQQVLMNLALNARDAMPAGGKLVISTENVHLMSRDSKVHTGLRPGEYVLLSICDNGCGMDRETLHRIFEPFFSTKEKGKGTGLGLSTVYGIVKSHGGDITCYSEPGQGTSFQVYLPCVTLEAKKEESTEIGQILGGQETLLLIDDEEYLRNLGEEILTRFGYSVITAPSAREGLRLYEENRDRIALVLLDVIMPEMSGKECLREILKIDPLAKVILVSGYANASSLESDDYRRARGFVRKPYESRRLLELVRSVLDEPELIEEND